MIFKLLYHKPSKEVIAIKRSTWVFSSAQDEGDYVIVPLDTDNYDAQAREVVVTLGTVSKSVPLSILAKRLDLDERVSFYDDHDVLALIDAKETEWLHNKLVALQGGN